MEEHCETARKLLIDSKDFLQQLKCPKAKDISEQIRLFLERKIVIKKCKCDPCKCDPCDCNL